MFSSDDGDIKAKRYRKENFCKLTKKKPQAKLFWHKSGYILKSDCGIFTNGTVSVDLFDKNGNKIPNFTLYIENSKDNIHVDLFSILEKRIKIGVENFFSAFTLSFDKRNTQDYQDILHIFLAGNSSKSPILHKCFKEAFIEFTRRVSDGKESDPRKYLKIYYPLGTPQADQIQKKKNHADYQAEKNNVMRPTGKTGVAYGLIMGRPGGSIKVIPAVKHDEEIRFRYYVGRKKRKYFKIYMDRNIPYNKWVEFIDASENEFEIYFSDLPESASGEYAIGKVSKKYCKIEHTDPDANIYIRAVKPSEIEYAVAKNSSDIEKGNVIGKIYTLKLS